jgi:hypothetical protein
MFCTEIAFFKERVGLNSRRLLEDFDLESRPSQPASLDGELGRLLPDLLESLSRRMSRRPPSASNVSSLDDADDAKDKLDEDDAAE